jgi:hypothetical protein
MPPQARRDQAQRNENAGGPSGPNVSRKDEHQRGDEQLAASHAEKTAYKADANPDEAPCGEVNEVV